MSFSLVALATVLCGTAASRPAWPAESGSVAVVAVRSSLHGGSSGGPTDHDRERVLAALGREVRYRGLVIKAVPLERLSRLLAEMRRDQGLAAARNQAREGSRLLGHLQLAPAVKELRSSLDGYAMLQPDATACREATAPLRDLAFAHWQGGEKDRAAALIAGASQLPPSQIDTRRYPPPFVAFLRQPHALQPLTVTLPTLPAGATVWHNCKPATTEKGSFEVTGGALVKVAAPGHRGWSGLVSSAARTTVVLAQLEPEPVLWEGGVARFVPLLQAQQIRWLVLWRRQGGSLQIRAYRAGAARMGPWRPLPPLRPKPVPRPAAPTSLPVADRRDAGAGAPRIGAATWILAGTGAAALVAGTVCGVLARDAADTIEDAAARGELFDDRLADLEARRRQAGTAAYVLWGIGAASAVGGLVLWLTKDRSSPREVTVRANFGGGGLTIAW